MYRWTLCEKIVFALPFDKSKSKYYYYDGDTYGHWNGILYVFYGMAMMYLHNGLHGDSFVSMYFSILLKLHYGVSIAINYYGAACSFLFGKIVLKNKVVKVV